MVFKYTGKSLPNLNEIEEEKKFFFRSLNEPKEEFEQRVGCVTINFDEPKTSPKRWQYGAQQSRASLLNKKLDLSRNPG